MTFAEMQARLTVLLSFEGWSDVDPTPDYAGLINRALVDFAWDTEYFLDSETIETQADMAEYRLAGALFKSFSDVTYGTDRVLKPSSEAEERNMDFEWLLRPSGVPARYVVVRPNVVRLVDTPSDAGVTVTFRGVRSPKPLSQANEVLAVPETFHEALPLRGAVLHGQIYAQGEARARLEDWRRQYAGLVAQFRGYLGAAKSPSLIRRVTVGDRRRVPLAIHGR